MPYQGSAASSGSDAGGSVGTVAMPTEAPPDLGTGAGGLMQIGQTQVVGQSGTAGATLPVDALQQASNMIVQGKADLNQTAGAENRLDGFDGVGGGGGGGGAAAGTAAQGTANEATDSGGLGGDTSPNAGGATSSSGSGSSGSSSANANPAATNTAGTAETAALNPDSGIDNSLAQFDTGSPAVINPVGSQGA